MIDFCLRVLHPLGWRAWIVVTAGVVGCVTCYYLGRTRQYLRDARRAMSGASGRGRPGANR